mmetsp:Transcript_27989/g.59703  ORF Transcript_27989/g.59703 Transcript_27989/m.59703 type:complete len:211 (-) Transcript_27989:397-1029(-)
MIAVGFGFFSFFLLLMVMIIVINTGSITNNFTNFTSTSTGQHGRSKSPPFQNIHNLIKFRGKQIQTRQYGTIRTQLVLSHHFDIIDRVSNINAGCEGNVFGGGVEVDGVPCSLCGWCCCWDLLAVIFIIFCIAILQRFIATIINMTIILGTSLQIQRALKLRHQSSLATSRHSHDNDAYWIAVGSGRWSCRRGIHVGGVACGGGGGGTTF